MTYNNFQMLLIEDVGIKIVLSKFATWMTTLPLHLALSIKDVVKYNIKQVPHPPYSLNLDSVTLVFLCVDR
jgi:hypothetical protein